jgi:hypothetical protein
MSKPIKNEATTFSQFAQSEAETFKGRFTTHEQSTVVGSTPITKYEGEPNWAHDPVPTESPLGFDNPALDNLGPTSLAAQGNSPNPERAPLVRVGLSSPAYRRR